MINEIDLSELRGVILTGVTVGRGSQILIFANGFTVLTQCPFKCESLTGERWGHGEDVETSVLLFDFLNCQVERAFFDEGSTLVFKFNGAGSLAIVPEHDGLESYVVNTGSGIFPISVV